MNPLGSFGSTPDGEGAKKPQASMTELFSSAKVVSEAAQATFSGAKEKVDPGKAAGAAADLLGASSQYTKLDDKGIGGYVKKAETYLHEYEASHATKPAGGAPAAHSAPPPGSTPPPGSAPPLGSAPPPGSAPAGGEDEKKESNYGDYLKTAQGFFK